MAKATAHSFEIVEGESGGRLFAAGITEDKVDRRGRVGLRVFRRLGTELPCVFVFKPGDQHVDSGSDLSSNRIPGLERSCNAINTAIKC